MHTSFDTIFEMFDESWNLGIIALSLVAMAASLLTGATAPFDPAWFALVLCAAPIAVKAVGCATARHFDAFNVFALLAVLAALATGSVFGAASIALLARFVASFVAIEGERFE